MKDRYDRAYLTACESVSASALRAVAESGGPSSTAPGSGGAGSMGWANPPLIPPLRPPPYCAAAFCASKATQTAETARIFFMGELYRCACSGFEGDTPTGQERADPGRDPHPGGAMPRDGAHDDVGSGLIGGEVDVLLRPHAHALRRVLALGAPEHRLGVGHGRNGRLGDGDLRGMRHVLVVIPEM